MDPTILLRLKPIVPEITLKPVAWQYRFDLVKRQESLCGGVGGRKSV